jgi:hypothetical protein
MGVFFQWIAHPDAPGGYARTSAMASAT